MSTKPQLINGEFYHVYNRGVEKRSVFQAESDYFRFIRSLYEFNDKNLVSLKDRQRFKNRYYCHSYFHEKKLLVEILCFCLMPNHFHLILRQLVKSGISLFMQKLCGGYTGFFNLKYQRVGSLFQGPYKAKHISHEDYLIHLSRYLHINSVELIEPNWKTEGVKDWEKVKDFLESYRWSSYLDYIGKENFPSVTSRDFILGFFDSFKDYKKFVYEWIIEDFNKIENLALE